MSLSVPNANGTWVCRSQCGQRPWWKWNTTCFNKQITAVVGCGYNLRLGYPFINQKHIQSRTNGDTNDHFTCLVRWKGYTQSMIFGILRTSIRYHLGKRDKTPHLTCLCPFFLEDSFLEPQTAKARDLDLEDVSEPNHDTHKNLT